MSIPNDSLPYDPLSVSTYLQDRTTNPAPESVQASKSSFNGRNALLLTGAVIAGVVAAVAAIAAVALFFPPVAAAIGIGGLALMGTQIGLGSIALIGGAAWLGFVLLASRGPAEESGEYQIIK